MDKIHRYFLTQDFEVGPRDKLLAGTEVDSFCGDDDYSYCHYIDAEPDRSPTFKIPNYMLELREYEVRLVSTRQLQSANLVAEE